MTTDATLCHCEAGAPAGPGLVVHLLSADGAIMGSRHGHGAPTSPANQTFAAFFSASQQAEDLPQRLLARAAHDGHLVEDGWRVRPDGSKAWVHMELTALTNEEGELMGYVHRQHDLGDRAHLHAPLAVQQETLVKAQKADTIAQIAGGVAHDFNNLFMVVSGSLELMPRWLSDDPKAHQILQGAMEATQRGAALIRHLLAFARRQQLKPAPIRLHALLDSMYDILERSMGSRISIVRDVPEDLPTILADANQLEMVILNLALNARDAMPAGGQLTLQARLQAADQGQPMLCLTMEDTGCGMDADTLARAADPFFTTKAVGQGTGLGLSMAQGMVEQTGGQLVLESTPGVGTRVEVWLPVMNISGTGVSLPEPTHQTKHAAIDTQVSKATSPLRILVVDDDDLVRETTVARLEEDGHQVHAEPSAQEALVWLSQRAAEVDLILTDQVMPGMTGTMLAAQVRKDWPALPIVLASGYMGTSDTWTTFDLVRLEKPFTGSQLNQAIHMALGDDAKLAVHE